MILKKKSLSAVFALLVLFLFSLLLSSCTSSVDTSGARSAKDTEQKLGVNQYKPEPEKSTQKKDESKHQPVSQPSNRQELPKTTTTTDSETPKPQPAPSVVHSQSDTYLPDFKAFTNNKARFDNVQYDDNSKKAHYSITVNYDKYSNDDVIQEYINLITSKYNFKYIGSDNGKPAIWYGFVYTGTGSVKQFNESITKHKDKINLRISFFGGSSNGDNDEVVIRYGDGINYVDTGDRTRYQIDEVKEKPQSSGGGGGGNIFIHSSGPEVKPYEIKDRPCFRCNGTGYIEEFIYDNKTPHYGGIKPRPGALVKTTCPDCHGRGRIDL